MVDSAKAIAAATAKLLADNKLLNNNIITSDLNLFVSDLPARFETVARRFLGEKISNVEKIQLS